MPSISMSSQSNKEEYGCMLVSVYRVNPDTGNPIDDNETKASTKFDATQNLHQIGSRLNDAGDLLSESLEVLTNTNAKKKASQVICK